MCIRDSFQALPKSACPHSVNFSLLIPSIAPIFPKPATAALIGSKISYSELTINLIVDEDMTAYKEMQSWMERTISETDSSKLYNDITLIILSSHNNPNKSIRYRNCIPTQIGGIEFTSTSGDTSFITFDATFRFSEFDIL